MLSNSQGDLESYQWRRLIAREFVIHKFIPDVKSLNQFQFQVSALRATNGACQGGHRRPMAADRAVDLAPSVARLLNLTDQLTEFRQLALTVDETVVRINLASVRWTCWSVK
jgi:hypothetical protein